MRRLALVASVGCIVLVAVAALAARSGARADCESWAATEGLHDVEVDPFHKRDQCQARTADGEYRYLTVHGGWTWWAVGGAGLVGAVVLAAVGLAPSVEPHAPPDLGPRWVRSRARRAARARRRVG